MLGASISSSITDADEVLVTAAPLRQPTHPGELVGEIVGTLGLSMTGAARELGVTRQTLHRLAARKVAVTPEMALRLGRWAGNGPGLWLRMQQAFDLWQAERRMADELARIPSHAAPL